MITCLVRQQSQAEGRKGEREEREECVGVTRQINMEYVKTSENAGDSAVMFILILIIFMPFLFVDSLCVVRMACMQKSVARQPETQGRDQSTMKRVVIGRISSFGDCLHYCI